MKNAHENVGLSVQCTEIPKTRTKIIKCVLKTVKIMFDPLDHLLKLQLNQKISILQLK